MRFAIIADEAHNVADLQSDENREGDEHQDHIPAGDLKNRSLWVTLVGHFVGHFGTEVFVSYPPGGIRGPAPELGYIFYAAVIPVDS